MAERILLRPSELVDMLGMGRSKIYSMIERGEIPSVRFGKSVRVRSDKLAEWLDTHMIVPPDER